jgi:hypothetical protein
VPKDLSKAKFEILELEEIAATLAPEKPRETGFAS